MSQTENKQKSRPGLNMRRLRAGNTMTFNDVFTAGGPVQSVASLLRGLDTRIEAARESDSLVMCFTVHMRHMTLTSGGEEIDSPSQAKLAEAVGERLAGLDNGIVSVAGRVNQIAGFADGFRRKGEAETIGNNILSTLRQPFDIDGRMHHFESRIGISILEEDTPSSNQLLSSSLLALAETDTSTPFLRYNARVQKRYDQQLALGHDLAQALDDRVLEVEYQPVLGLRERKLVGIEAFVRWNHPERGMIPPGQLVRLAEKTDTIYAIGQHVLTGSMEAARSWSEAGVFNGVTLWVNFAPSEILHHDFRDLIKTQVDRSHAVSVGIDLLEGAAISERQVSETIRAIALDDVRSAIDNFDGDFSLLTRSQQLPFDTLKLSHRLVSTIEPESDGRRIAELAIDLAHRRSIEVVAVGVESKEQLRILEEIGVDAVQGNLLSKPLPADQIVPLLEIGTWIDGAKS